MTLFKQSVYAAVRQIPKGRVLTYRQVAEKIGRPKAYRAVGNALNKNHDPLIPCHRVIKSSGDLGGYNQGRTKKIQRLRQEGFLKN